MTDRTSDAPLYTHHAGPSLLETPLLNKGSAFSEEERRAFNLAGLLPPRYETIEQQLERVYAQYQSFVTPINKHVYLRSIQDTNETLYYRLVKKHIDEMMPIIYTPTVGDACEKFSDIYTTARGLFLSYTDKDELDDILRNAIKRNVKVIVVTDGERILGLGDQGIGGMGIPIGKLALYTACGGISPAYTLPIMLDVGTNNRRLLDDPRYMGLREQRIGQDEYDDFIEVFMAAVRRRWPDAMVQFEDFAQQNATPILSKYREKYCCFNDDIQGTAAVTVGTLLAACKSKGQKLSDQTVVFLGGGSAGCGIAEQIIRKMMDEGISYAQARRQIFMVDRQGLTTDETPDLMDFQQTLVQPASAIKDWQYSAQFPSLLEVIENIHPTVLIGVSGQAGLFTEDVVRTMHAGCAKPIIFPLSNPSRRVEAHPEKVLQWTDGEAIVATGSPFEPVDFNGESIAIAQCNNSYIFPGIGLGVVACKAKQITDQMLMAASDTLADNSPLVIKGRGALLPSLQDVDALSKKIAFAVAKVAQSQGHALEISDELLHQKIDKTFWLPEYRPYKRVSV